MDTEPPAQRGDVAIRPLTHEEKSGNSVTEAPESRHHPGFRGQTFGSFGSCARGEATQSSDLDFVVELQNETFDAYMDLKEFLEELFHCSVDLVLIDAIKPRLRETILGEAIYAS